MDALDDRSRMVWLVPLVRAGYLVPADLDAKLILSRQAHPGRKGELVHRRVIRPRNGKRRAPVLRPDAMEGSKDD